MFFKTFQGGQSKQAQTPKKPGEDDPSSKPQGGVGEPLLGNKK